MRRVDKPWGHEVIWAETPRYAGKLLSILAGHMLSLQYHEVKAESIYVQSGTLHLHLADAPDAPVRVVVLKTGEAFDIVPGMVHRFEAREDVVLIEVSTPELTDIVRISDQYGRTGTVAP